jgi:hypothetical protein
LNKTVLNQVAVAAKNDEALVWEIIANYTALIEKLQLENWHKMNSETAFEDDCFRKIRYAIKTYDPTKGDFESRAQTLIYQSVKEHCGRRGNRRSVLTSLDKEITTEDGSRENTFLQTIKDDTVDVEAQAIEEITKEELLRGYAETDIENMIVDIILESEALISQSEITRRLAKKTGRTFNSARGVVRTFCFRKQALA